MLGLRPKYVLLILAIVIASPVAYYLMLPLFISVTVIEQSPQTEGQSQPKLLGNGRFIDADSFHRTSGTAIILQFVNGSRILRLEGFQTTNGPDLYIYLATDRDAKDFLNIGRLKGNIGDQNYVIPADADLTRYKYVLIWCRAFAVLFGSAELL